MTIGTIGMTELGIAISERLDRLIVQQQEIIALLRDLRDQSAKRAEREKAPPVYLEGNGE